MTLTYRWLGVAGLEFELDGFQLLIDPFFTRPGKAAVATGARVPSNQALAGRYVPRASAVLITHPHYDHLLDVPGIIKRTGAAAYGSPNTCVLLQAQGIPSEQAQCIRAGDRFSLGPFQVEVFPARHTRIPFARRMNGELPAQFLQDNAQSRRPLRLTDYRMDACYSFRIQAAGLSLLVGNHPVASDVLFIAPYHSGAALAQLLGVVNPSLVVPIHWDDFTRPLSRPVLPMLLTPAQGLRPIFPPVRRMDLKRFTQAVRSAAAGVEVNVPRMFESYRLPPEQG